MTAVLPDTLCFLDGQFLPLNQARVSVLDRGFIFGDGVYEAIPVYARRPFHADAHFARLSRSLAALRIPLSLDPAVWQPRLQRLIDAQPADDQLLYIEVTRGVAPRGHAMPPGLEPTVFVQTSPLSPPSATQRHEGLAAVTARDFRWERGDIKSVSMLGNVLARQIAVDAGADECVLLRDGPVGGPWLTEGSSSNIWVVHEGAVLGPPSSTLWLEGIRVELLAELCDDCGIAFNRRPLSEAEVRTADELLLSSATREVIAITRLDGEGVGHGALRGRPGPVYSRLFEAYQRAKRASVGWGDTALT